ncbi:MAG: preprotein translocase subunit SecA [Betaproteobacteria bacterium]|nr:MAG: preprotein translocase subunit SecA [Betaproteobacteria bacterium]TMI12997.1 MAG: preprotein translocase subunit SecA [Betaproteobacteria bacterium]
MKIIDFLRKLLEVLWSVPTRLFGSRNERLLKHYSGAVAQINALEPEIAKLPDAALAAKTGELKKRYSEGATLEQLLPEAFAVVREAAKRTLRMRHFDVQLVGGMVLHDGKIAEMKTGEGKTLVATLPAYLNALSGAGVHIVTVNDYLASRDADWMGKIYRFLGLSVGVNLPHMEPADKRKAYAADITYGTNNEFGFDYLRDNMAMHVDERFQRGLHYAIVDEVDSILIDEARTPLIISGQAEDRTEIYYRMNEVAPLLTRQKEENAPGDFWVDEKNHQILLSESGHQKAEEILARIGMLPQGASLYEPAYINLVHQLYAALRAHHLFHRDQHYVVQDGQVVIVDEFTGRLMQGRRWSDGLHQAVEAKENVAIQNENQTLASITFQNYFRMYRKLAGMTGTADTEAYEFQQIYGLETVVIPTHMDMIREDRQDQVYRTAKEKYHAVIRDIKGCYERGQPVLVGTTSIENSELLSGLLGKDKLPHQVLNAKQHAREAEIVAQAGRPKMITIATNMAGRGTDIVLGGNVEKQCELIDAIENLPPEEKKLRADKLRGEWQALHNQVVKAGGLHIIGTERHESRRIDNQLRGRSGRQGDPGSSRFYMALEDPLLRIFAGDRINRIMVMLKMPEGEAIEHAMVTRSIESAQRKVEARNFDIRKQLLEYDDVANDQRKEIYAQRNEILDAKDVSALVTRLRAGVITDIFRQFVPEESVEEQWDMAGLETALKAELHLELPLRGWLEAEPELDDEGLLERITEKAHEAYQGKIPVGAEESFRQYERYVTLQVIDAHWREHLAALDHLRQGIHLRGYAQKNPKQEYKREAFELFGAMVEAVKLEVTKTLTAVQIRTQDDIKPDDQSHIENVRPLHPTSGGGMEELEPEYGSNGDVALAEAATKKKAQPIVRHTQKVGRNDPCPCGSGKKYKHCHGKLT